jgi:hypothetical protein
MKALVLKILSNESRRVGERKKRFPFRKELSQLTVRIYIIIYNLGHFFLGVWKQFWELHRKNVYFLGRHTYLSVEVAGFCREDGRHMQMGTMKCPPEQMKLYTKYSTLSRSAREFSFNIFHSLLSLQWVCSSACIRASQAAGDFFFSLCQCCFKFSWGLFLAYARSFKYYEYIQLFF